MRSGGGEVVRRWAGRGALAGAVVMAAFAGGALFGAEARAVPGSASPYRNLGVFARVLAHVETSYVEDVDQDALVYGAIRGMVETLDPHSGYMDPEEYRILTSDTEGRFGGIGVEIDVRDGFLTVLSVMDGGPAARAGVRAGDAFLAIEGRGARDLPIDEAVRRMRGAPGTTVRVRLRREGVAAAIDVTLTREIIQVNAVESRVLGDRIVYVQLKAFQDTTTTELRRALDEAVQRTASSGGVRGVLLDMRQNPGGLLDQAVLVSDEFMESGVIVSTRGRGGQLISEDRASSRGTRPSWPMVVLVDGYTASAAEIVAGALQDSHRALVLGTRSFGKGSVQNIIELSDGSALKLTVARYYTPSGRSIQAHGIEPDIVIEQVEGRAPGAGETIHESDLDRHLRGDHEDTPSATPAPPTPRGTPRTAPPPVAAADAAPFPEDFQARMAHQILRGLSQPRAPRE